MCNDIVIVIVLIEHDGRRPGHPPTPVIMGQDQAHRV